MIDYERSFKKLVEQIEMERGFVINERFNKGETEHNKGMFFAYDSIFRLAKKLENDEFFIYEDDEMEDEYEEA